MVATALPLVHWRPEATFFALIARPVDTSATLIGIPHRRAVDHNNSGDIFTIAHAEALARIPAITRLKPSASGSQIEVHCLGR